MRDLGLAIIELGGGRRKSSDKINPAVGMSSLKRVGDSVTVGEPLAVIHAMSLDAARAVEARVGSAYVVSGAGVSEPLIWQMI